MILVLYYTHCKLFILINKIPFDDSLVICKQRERKLSESVTRQMWERIDTMNEYKRFMLGQNKIMSRWCILVHNMKLWPIVLRIGTKQEQIPFLATTSGNIWNSAWIFITFFNTFLFTAHIQRFWNANNEYCCLHKNIYLSEVNTFSYLDCHYFMWRMSIMSCHDAKNSYADYLTRTS